jgi:pyruvate/2-oxoglutarate dehydrogenase complex dihydrolipoamide dehydrogenase (E3) component
MPLSTCETISSLVEFRLFEFATDSISIRGIKFHTEESPRAIIKSANGLLSLNTNKGTVEGFSHVMFATRRRPNTKVFKFLFHALLLSVTAFNKIQTQTSIKNQTIPNPNQL